MLFPDYSETQRVYHIVNIVDLEKVMDKGIRYDDKYTYEYQYFEFHDFIDKERTKKIPPWVVRKKAIFASMNFSESHYFHSHSAILAVKIDPKKCWVANENLANYIYEPFILQSMSEFEDCKTFLETEGKRIIKEYWNTSLSFEENLTVRRDREKGYDAEVLIFHDIKPDDLELLYIVSDHHFFTKEGFLKRFAKI